MSEGTPFGPIWERLTHVSRRRAIWSLAGLVFLGAFAFWTLSRVSLSDIVMAASRAEPRWTLLALAGFAMGQGWRVLRSRRILQRCININGRPVGESVLGGQIINWLSPIRLGDVWRIWRVSRGSSGALLWSASSVAIEKGGDAIVLSIFAFAMLFLPLPATYASPIVKLVLIVIGCVLLVSALTTLSSARVREGIRRKFPQVAPILRFTTETGELSMPRYLLAWTEVVVHSLGIWLIAVLTNVALAQAFGLGLGVAGHLLLLIALQTSMVLSPIPANLGLQSVVSAGILVPLGFGEAPAIAYGAALWLFSYGTLLVLGCSLWALRKMRESSHATPAPATLEASPPHSSS